MSVSLDRSLTDSGFSEFILEESCINKDTETKELCKLNLGCGNNILKDYINVDQVALEGVNWVLSLEDTYLPLKDNSVSEIICDHVLEHIDNFITLMEEFYRVCAPEAIIRVKVPYYKYEGAFRDPTHRRFFTERTFDYFHPDNKYNYYSKARFHVEKCKLTRAHKIERFRIEDVFLRFIPFAKVLNFFFFNIFTEISFELRVKKSLPIGGEK